MFVLQRLALLNVGAAHSHPARAGICLQGECSLRKEPLKHPVKSGGMI